MPNDNESPADGGNPNHPIADQNSATRPDSTELGGAEDERRHNKVFYAVNQVGAFTVALPYRSMNDPRVMVAAAGPIPGLPGAEHWITNKYPALGSPLRLASSQEAQLIRAEALAQMDQIAFAEAVINGNRALHGLPALTFANRADALAKIIEERRRELSFEGGHRLNDLLRYNIPWKVGASPFDARLYGTTTCWPFPA